MIVDAMAPWMAWEDWHAGLYRPDTSPEAVTESAALLGDPDRFAEAAIEMLREWPIAARHNLQAMVTGRSSWIGQATCCYSHGATGVATRQAWGQLTNDQQRRANFVARRVREQWERGSCAETLFVD